VLVLVIVLVIDIFLPVVFKKIDSFYDFPDQHEGNFCLKLRLHPLFKGCLELAHLNTCRREIGGVNGKMV